MQIDYIPFSGRMIKNYEGGYCWDKGDPGGPTNYGITCFDLAAHRHQRMNSMAAWAPIVKAMTLDEAEEIYRTKYAVGVRFADLPAGVDCCMLDYGVNSGVARPIHVARALVGLAPGVMDDALINAINKVNPVNLIDEMCAERLRFMHSLKGGEMWARFGHGWGARVADLKSYSDHIAVGGAHINAPQPVDLSTTVTPKAINVPKTAGTATSVTAIASATAAHTAGFPIYTVGAIAVGVLVAGVLYEAYHEQAAAAANAKVTV